MKGNLEQIIIQGLEFEAIEKIKSAERKALTRKNGLKEDVARYTHDTTGQTRDIVATKLGICGRQWDKIKYIYTHKEDCDQLEYEEWNVGRISTSKLYSKLKNNEGILKDIYKINEMISKFDLALLKYMENLECQIEGDFYIRDRIYPLIEDFKKQFPRTYYDSYASLSSDITVISFNSLKEIQQQIEKMKSKI